MICAALQPLSHAIYVGRLWSATQEHPVQPLMKAVFDQDKVPVEHSSHMVPIAFYANNTFSAEGSQKVYGIRRAGDKQDLLFFHVPCNTARNWGYLTKEDRRGQILAKFRLTIKTIGSCFMFKEMSFLAMIWVFQNHPSPPWSYFPCKELQQRTKKWTRRRIWKIPKVYPNKPRTLKGADIIKATSALKRL